MTISRILSTGMEHRARRSGQDEELTLGAGLSEDEGREPSVSRILAQLEKENRDAYLPSCLAEPAEELWGSGPICKPGFAWRRRSQRERRMRAPFAVVRTHARSHPATRKARVSVSEQM